MSDGAAIPHPAAPRRSVSGQWVVIGAAAMVLAAISVFIVAALGQPRSVHVSGSPPLPAAAAAPLLRPITGPGAPPDDVLSRLVVPVGSRPASYLSQDTPEGQYDRQATLAVPQPLTEVVSFYAQRLAALGWRVASVTVSRDGRGRQVVAERLSRDSYTWDVGVTVEPASSGCRVVLRLFQRSET
ncbi:MAG TPA: hypothetical protein VFA11_14005 [Acidimicrobiales bacterium]|nr:hypothetical protein [Acidimicrobiales bacterium]